MELKNAKVVVIITETVIKSGVIRLLKSLKVKGFSVYHGVTGEGHRGVRHGSGGLGVHSGNVRIETVVSSEERATLIMQTVYEEYLKNYAGIVYTQDVCVVRIDKFSSDHIQDDQTSPQKS